MSDLQFEINEDYVYYCRNCHSLCVIVDESLVMPGWDGSYCGKCHSTDIGICLFDEWLAEEERRRKKREEIEWNK
jgi:hypothetical protein